MQNKPLFILKTPALGKPLMDYIKSDKYLVSSDGQIRFTEQGLRDLVEWFFYPHRLQ